MYPFNYNNTATEKSYPWVFIDMRVLATELNKDKRLLRCSVFTMASATLMRRGWRTDCEGHTQSILLRYGVSVPKRYWDKQRLWLDCQHGCQMPTNQAVEHWFYFALHSTVYIHHILCSSCAVLHEGQFIRVKRLYVLCCESLNLC